MSGRNFSLQPFSSNGHLVKITGSIFRRANTIAVSYRLTGPLVLLDIPPVSSIPGRQHGLWEGTCFELFLASLSSSAYWEFNLSPSGHWNVYRFSSYRCGMREEPGFSALPFEIQNHSGHSLKLSFKCHMDGMVDEDERLIAGISAVIKGKNGELTYWALSHPDSPADFHNRKSFILEL